MPPLIELIAEGARVPYGICLDSQDRIWVSSKGGVFQFDRAGRCLFADKYDHPKRTLAFSAIQCVHDRADPTNDRILVKYADRDGCFLALYDTKGTRLATSILDSYGRSLAVAQSGDVFITTQPTADKSELLRGHVDDLNTFEPILTSDELQFDQICCIPASNHLVVSCARQPISPYSDQHMLVVDLDGRTVAEYARQGKTDGEIHCARAVQVSQKGNTIILDKTGRLQEFDPIQGRFIRLVGTIPSGLGNGFCIDEERKQLLVSCSGLVLSEGDRGEVECNDWIECIPID